MAKNYKIHQETRKYDPGTIEEVINESRSRDSPDNAMSDWALKISRIKMLKDLVEEDLQHTSRAE